ncbi:P-II family nitrogen regulator [Brotonthovivens ammoniilytica]|uniref:P-II family nitrogen regulator n=1 Tax=Brotonthovivens ammoniilytica TaxID=2981725 RepID=A0ABT2TIQ8_9FIRM|nr:P-II family nitrogen regulator [Brotonthovivens ammoniilytica]MCU6762095.1 P-II family nitrogen regulator [Brotonthovivens ammoniilytica]
MIKIEAIVRNDRMEEVIDALNAIHVNGMTVSQVMGYGQQRGYTEVVRGTEVDIQMIPKVKFEVVVSNETWEEKVIAAIQRAAYTGEYGDGKIFTYEIRSALRIRTKESGEKAIYTSEK